MQTRNTARFLGHPLEDLSVRHVGLGGHTLAFGRGQARAERARMKPTLPESRISRLGILIVEPTLGSAARRAVELTEAGAHCWVTSDLEEAAKLGTEENRIRLLLVDCALGRPGADLVSKLRSLRPDATAVGICPDPACSLCWLGVDHSLRGRWSLGDLEAFVA